MKNHIERLKNIFENVGPDENSLAFKKLKESHKKMLTANPGVEKEWKKRFEIACRSLTAQDLSGAGLIMSDTLRHFLNEYNRRVWKHGLRKMPQTFNILEAFFNYDKSIIYFELAEEEDYLISLFDFIDFITSTDFKEDKSLITEHLTEDLIYNYHVGSDIDSITFKTDDSKTFVIGGISIIRRKNEAIVLLATGMITDLSQVPEFSFDNFIPTPGKENLEYDRESPNKPEPLNDNPNYWKTLASCRFDLEKDTIDAKYLAIEYKNTFDVKTDDLTGYIKADGTFNEKYRIIYKAHLEELKKYDALFEVAKLSLYLPYYFNRFEEDILEEDHETEFKKLNSKPLEKRQYGKVSDRFKHILRTVWVMNKSNKFKADRITIREDLFKIETSGYWKTLQVDEVGVDKKGNSINGKTWVATTESWFEAKSDDLIVTKNDSNRYTEEGAGYIYLIRNPTMEENIFKIGLTTKTVDERIVQLSNTSVADKFFRIREWNVKDCRRAEKEIHEMLSANRLDPRREFFRVNPDFAIKIISETVARINQE